MYVRDVKERNLYWIRSLTSSQCVFENSVDVRGFVCSDNRTSAARTTSTCLFEHLLDYTWWGITGPPVTMSIFQQGVHFFAWNFTQLLKKKMYTVIPSLVAVIKIVVNEGGGDDTGCFKIRITTNTAFVVGRVNSIFTFRRQVTATSSPVVIDLLIHSSIQHVAVYFITCQRGDRRPRGVCLWRHNRTYRTIARYTGEVASSTSVVLTAHVLYGYDFTTLMPTDIQVTYKSCSNWRHKSILQLEPLPSSSSFRNVKNNKLRAKCDQTPQRIFNYVRKTIDLPSLRSFDRLFHVTVILSSLVM